MSTESFQLARTEPPPSSSRPGPRARRLGHATQSLRADLRLSAEYRVLRKTLALPIRRGSRTPPGYQACAAPKCLNPSGPNSGGMASTSGDGPDRNLRKRRNRNPQNPDGRAGGRGPCHHRARNSDGMASSSRHKRRWASGKMSKTSLNHNTAFRAALVRAAAYSSARGGSVTGDRS